MTERGDLAAREAARDRGFVGRHIGPQDADCAAMLAALGHDSLAGLIDAAVPEAVRKRADIPWAEGPMAEEDALARLKAAAQRNRAMKSFIGLGYYGVATPPTLQRNLIENPAWYTAYTPYQPEISQGRLEALLNYQTMVIELTGMEVANASMLDEATAAAEAMTLCWRLSKVKDGVFAVDAAVFPQTLDVVRVRAEPLGIEVVVGDVAEILAARDCFGALLQYPDADGCVKNLRATVAAAHDKGALVACATDLMALTLLTPPGDWGVDVAVGSSQRFGTPMMYGGPHAAFFATRNAHVRAMPGRLVGVSVDADGRPALRLALQTREQHIRREKATSNICTAQALLANLAGLYACWHGPDGLRAIGGRIHALARALAGALAGAGLKLRHDAFFDTLVVDGVDADAVIARAREAGINLGRAGGDAVRIALDETATRADLAVVASAFGVGTAIDEDAAAPSCVVGDLARSDPPLRHPIFSRLRSETDMLRYLRKLADKDLALDRAMIPLGSCTMKLNAAAEMAAITWPEFANVHPFAPPDQAEGYADMFASLEAALAAVTGYDAVSLQPNSGANGEYAGLLAIRGYLRAKGEGARDVCLIPASAHGTNPASAQLAGMKVVVVKTGPDGDVDVADLKAKAEKHRDALAALMITYPSTHGVFEARIEEICQIIHDHGGQVYLDGANLNALIGVAPPGALGADVSHLNLHKTFCIPHGGGGPGVGPIGVKAHLAPHLPGHRFMAGAETRAPVAAAPWGSAGVLPISWAYVLMMGAEGLKRASEVAILSANYVAKRLEGHYDVVYRGEGGYVAHECIIDCRGFKKTAGVTVDDIAKRLADYGFHAPTMSWPVAGTLMIEPTESEPKAEVDRFCDAMIAIRAEIRAIEEGAVAVEDSALRAAPHTAAALLAESWNRPYSRMEAAFPKGVDRAAKYWPPVARVDNAHGDRNLICACPPLSAYEDDA